MPNDNRKTNTYDMQGREQIIESDFIAGWISGIKDSAMKRDLEPSLTLMMKDIERHIRYGTDRSCRVTNDLEAGKIEGGDSVVSGQHLTNAIKATGCDDDITNAVLRMQEQTSLTRLHKTLFKYNDRTYNPCKTKTNMNYTFSSSGKGGVFFTSIRTEVGYTGIDSLHGNRFFVNDKGEMIDSDERDHEPDHLPTHTYFEKQDITLDWVDIKSITNDTLDPAINAYKSITPLSLEKISTALQEAIKLNNLANTSVLDDFKLGLNTLSECTESDEKFKAYMKKTFGIEGNDFDELFKGENELIKITAKKSEGGEPPFECLKNESGNEGQIFEFKRYGEKIVPQFIDLHHDGALKTCNFAVKYDNGLKFIFPKVKTEGKLTVDSRLDLVNYAMDVKQEKGAATNLLKSDQQGPLYLESLFFKETIDQLCDFKEKDLFSKDPEDIDHFRAHMEELLEHKIGPIMAKSEFQQDLAAINILCESLTKVSSVLGEENKELQGKVGKIVESLMVLYKQNEIKSNYDSEIEWYKGKTRLNLSGFIVFAAVAIVVPLFVVFPPAIPVLAIIVPVVFGVLSLAALGGCLYCNKSVKKQKQYLERYKRDIDPVKSTEFSSNKIPGILLNYMDEVRKARVNNTSSRVVKENQILIP
ncbi:MAG: hypothetical protein HON78_02655 [Legionellales bacterium]|jgi:hypothetical protein|nr:hypothetical protein [Legionellales bacterium]